jgi:hypothetical protein
MSACAPPLPDPSFHPDNRPTVIDALNQRIAEVEYDKQVALSMLADAIKAREHAELRMRELQEACDAKEKARRVMAESMRRLDPACCAGVEYVRALVDARNVRGDWPNVRCVDAVATTLKDSMLRAAAVEVFENKPLCMSPEQRTRWASLGAQLYGPTDERVMALTQYESTPPSYVRWEVISATGTVRATVKDAQHREFTIEEADRGVWLWVGLLGDRAALTQAAVRALLPALEMFAEGGNLPYPRDASKAPDQRSTLTKLQVM